MIRFLSQRKQSQQMVWIIVSAIVIFGMVIFSGIPSRSRMFGNSRELVDKDSVIAKVGGEAINAGEYINGLDMMLQAYQGFAQRSGGSQMNYSSLKGMGLDKTMLEGLIRKRIVNMEVTRLGLQPTEEEVKTRIRDQFSNDGKWIGFDKYKKFIERSGQTVKSFEDGIYDVIAEEKLKNFITAAVQVSAKEVEEQFKRENTSFNLNYVVVDPTTLKDKVTDTDAELKSFFDSRKGEFRIDKAQRKVDYLYVDQEAVGKTLEISDEELKKDFDPEKYLAGVRVSQIMLKVLAEKDDAVVKAKADQLVQQARGTNGLTPQDFASLARGNSQDTVTKDKGGDLGFLEKESIKPTSYLQRALTMKVNEITDPIKEGNNYYILRLTERKNKTFEEARPALLASARNRLSYKRASEITDGALKRLNETKDIKAVAAEIAQKIGVKPEDALRQTPFFAEGDEVPNIGSNPTFEETVAALKTKGEIGVKVGIRGGLAIPQLVDIREAHDAEFDEVKEKVKQSYKLEKAKELAAEKARALITEAGGKPEGLKTAAEKNSLKAESKETFRDGQSLDNFGALTQVTTMALALKEGEVVKEPVFGNEKYLVFGVNKRNEPDMSKYNEQSKAIKQRLLDERREMTFNAYVNSLKKKLKEQKQIVTYKEVIDNIFATREAASPAQ